MKDNYFMDYYDKNPKNLKLIIEIEDPYISFDGLVDNFTVFKSIEDILYLIYSNEKKSIICYDLNNEQIINEIKNAHNKYITGIKHNLIQNKNIDIIISIPYKDNKNKIMKSK